MKVALRRVSKESRALSIWPPRRAPGSRCTRSLATRIRICGAPLCSMICCEDSDSPGGAHRSGILAFDLRRGRISLCRARHGLPEPRSTHDKQAATSIHFARSAMGTAKASQRRSCADAAIFLLRDLPSRYRNRCADVRASIGGFPSMPCAIRMSMGPGQSLKNPYTGILAIFSTSWRAPIVR